MELSRRRVLTVGAAGLVAAGCTADPVPVARQGFDPNDWASVRDQFPLTHDVRQFSAYVLATHPRPVAEAIERHRAGLDKDTHGYLDSQGNAEDMVRAAAAEYLGGSAEDIALTDSTTMGLGLLYTGVKIADGQDVLTTEHDFYSTHQSLRMRGVPVRRVRLYDDPAQATADEMVARIKAGLTPTTRIVAVTWVHSVSGVKLPIRAIADVVAAHNNNRAPAERALLCVDAVHGLGVAPERVVDLGCDFLVSGTHKWLFGPRGTGIVWGKAWAQVDPVLPSFSGPAFGEWIDGEPAGPTTAALFTPGGYHSFEHRWAVAEAFRFQLAIGRERVAARTREQVERIRAGLAGIPAVSVRTPAVDSAGLVCFDVAGEEPQAVVARLAARGVSATVTPYRERRVRVGPSIATSDEDVDALIAALK
ncbi:MAG TPA: aminotransferase class V-fold PLP-dependent enzyme [Actinokineospora sp.]|jgi:selenocysteine lyase/cysteine desulfurase|nr:aminotransferase class V-fold PLP-dependent enzyme [Actinokineospora sp.]